MKKARLKNRHVDSKCNMEAFNLSRTELTLTVQPHYLIWMKVKIGNWFFIETEFLRSGV
jgi:hypothetical protein